MNLNPVSYEDRERLLELDTTGNDRSYLPTLDELAAEEDAAKHTIQLSDEDLSLVLVALYDKYDGEATRKDKEELHALVLRLEEQEAAHASR